MNIRLLEIPQLRWFLVARFLASLMSVVASVVPFDKWECGADNSTKVVAYDSAKSDCIAVMEDLNACCIVHDDCYNKQLGRGYCDNSFCKCIDQAAKKAEDVDKCTSSTDFACLTVAIFGTFPYVAASHEFNSERKTSPPPVHSTVPPRKTTAKVSSEPNHPKMITKQIPKKPSESVKMSTLQAKPSAPTCILRDRILHQHHTNLQKQCPQHRDQLNECCIDTQKCERLGDETLCQNQFVECLRSKIRLNPEEDKKCYEAIQAFTAASASSSDTEHKSSGLVNTIQIWSHETKELFVNITNRVKNHLENTPLKKLLLLVIIIVVVCMFAYMTFLNDDKVKWLKLKTPVKFAHEKARLIQMI